MVQQDSQEVERELGLTHRNLKFLEDEVARLTQDIEDILQQLPKPDYEQLQKLQEARGRKKRDLEAAQATLEKLENTGT